MSQSNYDVIIIGGRPAGASLAMHLAKQQLNVLVVDRATFPSFPAVASSPIIYEGTIRMLEELGLKEEQYVLPGGRVHQFVMEFVNYFNVVIPTSRMGLERSYITGLDRNHFDNAVWKHMENFAPYITTREGFSVTDVIRDESGKVTGIVGKSAGGAEERITADLVVGADGRYSMAAKKFGAKMVEERNEFTTAGYQAHWENVKPYAPGMPMAAGMYNTARGFVVIFMPVAQDKYHVIIYMRSQDFDLNGKTPQEYYLEQLQRIPQAFKRLEGATQTTKLEGMRPVENAYREAYGAGWALVGDAFHYKDPLDGQGIYDALTESKHLAEAIGEWKRGNLTWEQAGAQYKERAYASTYPMFNMTTGRVKKEMHSFPPPFIIKTLIRWMLSDPGYQRQYLRTMARVDDPAKLPTMPTLGMILRGIRNSFKSSPQPKVTTQTIPAAASSMD